MFDKVTAMSERETTSHSPELGGDNNGSVVVAVRVRPLEGLSIEAGGALSMSRFTAQQRMHRRGMSAQEGDKPAVRVGVDHKTVVVLDPDNLQYIRESFVFNHVFSPVLLDESLMGTDGGSVGDIARPSGDVYGGISSSGGYNSGVLGCCTKGTKLSAEDRRAELEQQEVYELLGAPLTEHFMKGHNSCLFAYGQEGSGKSYTLSGTARCVGVIPRICKDLLSRASAPCRSPPCEAQRKQEAVKNNVLPLQVSHMSFALRSAYTSAKSGGNFSSPIKNAPPTVLPPSLRNKQNASRVEVTISYMEVCNDWVRDLLKPKRDRDPQCGDADSCTYGSDAFERLKVRYYPRHGPGVEGLTTINVRTWEECWSYIQYGNMERQQLISLRKTHGHTHTIFRITSPKVGPFDECITSVECSPKIDVVELSSVGCLKNSRSPPNTAGITTYEDCRRQLREFNAVQRSLGVLSRVLQAVASGSKNAPYRENLLTHLLSDGLVGGSLTIFCATVLSDVCAHAETLTTLRYAAQTCSTICCMKPNVASVASTGCLNQKQLGTTVESVSPRFEGSTPTVGNDVRGMTTSVSLPFWSDCSGSRAGAVGAASDDGSPSKNGAKGAFCVECLPYIPGAKVERVGTDSYVPPNNCSGVTNITALNQGGCSGPGTLLRRDQQTVGLPPLTGSAGVSSSPRVSWSERLKASASFNNLGCGNTSRGGVEGWQLRSPSSVSDKPSSPSTSAFSSPRNLLRPSSLVPNSGTAVTDSPLQPHTPNRGVGRVSALASSFLILTSPSAVAPSGRIAGLTALGGAHDVISASGVTTGAFPSEVLGGSPIHSWTQHGFLGSPEFVRKKESRRNLVKVFTPEELQPSLASPESCSPKQSCPPTPILSTKNNPTLKPLATSNPVSPTVK
ncbi:kinesin, putative [Trypanosoma brucei gambiense DAL972]|uniref:Kinesin, putative n=1 Tax=Trypanosoma brucei gambiense (strain MHOM/CI/86/DAL972) TaxID=679716 RepID=C9ZT08_TRYB9|nr:kinesin, putative [Trypanosoma brucei gambiense DAL972]CBH12543.1 kinesin, putative [Trypanosoma brucei gambiense DAL972]|eukprot:XP_011774823.1 kinesin, putative [Trypanosoma brucei gambiense DAL972]